MRYRRKLRAGGVTVWFAYAAIVALAFYRTHHSLAAVAASAIVVLLLFYVPHLYWYWEILPDRLMHRRYFQRVSWPFSEIAFVGAMSGRATGRNAVREWVEIRNTSGQRMIVQPGDAKAFVAEMRKYLPEITAEL